MLVAHKEFMTQFPLDTKTSIIHESVEFWMVPSSQTAKRRLIDAGPIVGFNKDVVAMARARKALQAALGLAALDVPVRIVRVRFSPR